LLTLNYSETVSTADRRLYPRASIAILLFYAPYDMEKGLVDWDKIERTSTVDLSAGGVRFVSFKPYPLNTKFCLFFDLEAGSHLYYARVVRVEEGESHYLIASEFFDISVRERAELAEYVNNLLRRG